MNTKEYRFVSKIIKETLEGKIKWETARTNPTSISLSERLIDFPYKTVIDEKIFRLFKYESKYFIDEERFEWTTGYRLEMIQDSSEKSLYTFPETRNLSDLYDEIRRQIAGIDDFLNNYLKGDESQNSDPTDDLFK
jgi:hypothetical protein